MFIYLFIYLLIYVSNIYIYIKHFSNRYQNTFLYRPGTTFLSFLAHLAAISRCSSGQCHFFHLKMGMASVIYDHQRRVKLMMKHDNDNASKKDTDNDKRWIFCFFRPTNDQSYHY